MDWVFLSLIAYFLWAANNIVEKLISKNVKELLSFGVLCGIGEMPLLLIYFIFPVTFPSTLVFSLLLIGGALRIVSFLPYVKALFREELTRLVPIWNVAPVFTFTMSYFILSESFPPSFLAGFMLILAGSILLSLKKGITLKDGFYLMLLSTFLYSVQIIIVKYASLTLDVASILFWTAVGTFFTTILTFGLSKKRDVISKELTSMRLHLFLAFVFLGTVAVSLFAYAIWLGNSAIVTVLGGFQSIFLLVLGIHMKKELEEATDKKAVLQKAVSIGLMILGLAALYL